MNLPYYLQHTDYWVAALCVISLLIQIVYYFFVYLRVGLYTHHTPKQEQSVPVSIIICARNEADNLLSNLPSILTQDYPNYEVIVVNDCSSDNTFEILGTFKKQYPHLKFTTIEENYKFRHGKKLALTVGIKAASNEWLLLTDADCKASSNQWIRHMQQEMTDNKDIVLGYGGFHAQRGLLNNIIRYDSFFIALQYFGLALCGKAYMGVGRNLAYRKSLFFKNNGFASHIKIPCGDDDLFVNETATRHNTAIVICPESHTRCEAKNTWSEWVEQKSRHLSSSFQYKFSTKSILSLEILSRIVFYASSAYLVITGSYFPYAIAPLILRLAIQYFVFIAASSKMKEKHLWYPGPFYDFFLILFYMYIFLSKFIAAKYNK